MKIKNKKRFKLMVILYIAGYFYFCIIGGINNGIKISDNSILKSMILFSDMPVGAVNLSVNIFMWVIISFFIVLFILWQTDLSGVRLNRMVLICQGTNILMLCLSRGIVEWLVSGIAAGLLTMLTIIIVLFVIVSISVGLTYLIQKKNGMINSYEAFSDIMSEDEFEKWKRRKNKTK